MTVLTKRMSPDRTHRTKSETTACGSSATVSPSKSDATFAAQYPFYVGVE